MAAPNFVNGFGGNWTVGSSGAVVGNWTSDISCDLIPTVNTGGAGWKTHIPGALGASFSLETWVDTANGNVALFFPGQQGAFALSISAGAGTFTFAGTVKSAKVKNVAGGEVTLSVDVEANGPVTYSA